MVQRILVPLDGSACAERALPMAVRVAQASGGSILLLQVVASPSESWVYRSQNRVRTPRHEVLREIAPILAQVEEEESHAQEDRLVEAVRQQGLGVIGRQETRDALEHGEGEVLVLAEEAPLDERERNDLVRLATLTGAEVDLVK